MPPLHADSGLVGDLLRVLSGAHLGEGASVDLPSPTHYRGNDKRNLLLES
eukprot:COSAG06_NODE_61080_length_269_cov_0.435294_1_plen_49_part_01